MPEKIWKIIAGLTCSSAVILFVFIYLMANNQILINESDSYLKQEVRVEKIYNTETEYSLNFRSNQTSTSIPQRSEGLSRITGPIKKATPSEKKEWRCFETELTQGSGTVKICE